ncbi:asparagine synthase (glutamine-hydrolyzing) [Natrononativus amylolyticus]|uniref:asparagine synthase (glutamine-hydrolyzing) n=1 Tax=Natrononativus amylolyticus TaxID=2963434 RepID=UPI0020CFA950|nr:asparagine synthase (glutamine-hydrolyzing) [Natrononativus amylolyticus]
MCGITGLFDPDSSPNPEKLHRMNQCQEHRGPDAHGIFTDGPIGLAHRRLSIIDPHESGDQPIYNEDGSIVVIFNGEIYNYRSLRNSLITAGHQFSTETDTEVLVHLYEDYGPSFVQQLEGMFAFALWDSTKEQLVLARDQMGVKPLLLLQDGSKFGFASELPALLTSELDHGEIDKKALSQYFAFGYIPAPRTAFQNIRKVRPGERVVITDQGISRDSYYSLSVPKRTDCFDTATQKLRKRVINSIEKRLMSDVPLGAFLSGGIDSSIVVGTMAELMDEPVRTFTVGFDQDLFDESWAAREVAEYHGTNHHEFTMSADDVRDLIPTVLDQLGEPFADPSLMPSYVVARDTSQEVTVALSGDGADELFAGYDKYRVESLSKYYRALPELVREEVIEPTVNALPASRGSRVGTKVYQAQWFVNRSGPERTPERHFELMRIPTGNAVNVFTQVNPVRFGQDALSIEYSQLKPQLRDRDSLTKIQGVDTQYSLPNQMLQKVDLASMYNSLEVRVPFLDTAVVEYAMSLPSEYKLTWSDRKRVLKNAFSSELPPSIFERDKQGFDMPIGEWFKNELANDFRIAVTAVDLGILDNDAVLDVYSEHKSGQYDHGRFLWTVYVFKQWAKRMQDSGFISK